MRLHWKLLILIININSLKWVSSVYFSIPYCSWCLSYKLEQINTVGTPHFMVCKASGNNYVSRVSLSNGVNTCSRQPYQLNSPSTDVNFKKISWTSPRQGVQISDLQQERQKPNISNPQCLDTQDFWNQFLLLLEFPPPWDSTSL